MIQDPLPDINLLPKVERHHHALLYIFIIFFSITMIAFLLIGVFYFTTKSKITDTTEQLDDMEVIINDIESEIAALEAGGSELGDAVLFAENYDIPTSVLIKELVSFLPNEGYLTDYSYQNRETRIEIDFETLDIVSNYTTNLLNSNYIRDTKIDRVETFTVGDEEITDNDFNTVPRYKASFQLQLHKANVKGAKDDE